MIYYDTYSSPLGILTIASDGQNITGLWMEGQQHFALPESSIFCDDIPVITTTKVWLNEYFSGADPAIDHIPLRPTGTPFQQKVWQILRTIPYGHTITYGQIATTLGIGPMGAQAVGNAVGKNPISIMIPCHRVVGAKGLTGYAGGLQRKAFLLQLEKAEV